MADPLPIWLVSLYFCDGYYPWGSQGRLGPRDETAWRPHIDALHEEMGLHGALDPIGHHWAELFLKSLSVTSDQRDKPRWERDL